MSRRLAAIAVLFFSIALVTGCGYAGADEKGKPTKKGSGKKTAK